MRCSEQAIPVIVLLNKMDRTDALPFAELEVRHYSPRPPHQRHNTLQKAFNDAATAHTAHGVSNTANAQNARHVRCFSTSLAYSQGHQVLQPHRTAPHVCF
jgi:translation elongation factor EF-G